MKNIQFLILVLLLSFLNSQAHASAWETQNQWNESFEKKYQDWVRTSFKQDIFFLQGPYKKISTDCADATYGMRLIFSYENRLPFAFLDPRASDILISNSTNQFDHIADELERFRAFMNMVMDMTDTATLSRDTYPVALNREQIVPGTIYLATKTHSYQIVDLSEYGIPVLQSSTTPRQVRTLSRVDGYPHYVPGDYKPKKYADGFRRFKTPTQYGVPDSTLPGYSIEQFEIANSVAGVASAFYDEVQKKLGLKKEPLEDKAYRYMKALCYSAWDRAEAIYDAQMFFRRQYNQYDEVRCMTASEYDAYSTPGRDKKLRLSFSQLQNLTSLEGWQNASGKYKDYVNYIVFGPHSSPSSTGEDLTNYCDVNKQVGGPGRRMSLAELNTVLQNGTAISDPNAPLLQRWGIEPYQPNCPQY